MTDRELLELAAKAAGWEVVCSESDLHGCTDKSTIYTGLILKDVRQPWNPLKDDGDALRLAVELGLNVCIDRPPGIGEPCTQVIGVIGYGKEMEVLVEPHNGDSYAATRRAAAEIGKTIDD